MPSDKVRPAADNPIGSSEEDRLDRSAIAHQFAKTLRSTDATRGLVVGVLGPWGSGKSSFVNLMREQFAEDPQLPVIYFNPWMFSGTQQLVDFFFKEIAAELRLKDPQRFHKIADGLETYGDVLSPLALIPGFGAWWDRSSKAVRSIAKWYKEHKGGTRSLREAISDALKELDQPIVVVIDDIDRLSTEEVRDIFKLVRLTASFPNLIYLLAFDRERVERALDDTNVPGRAYLEKIIQLGFDLPAASTAALQREILGELNRVLGDVPDLRFDESEWPDVFVEVVEPLINNLRDVTRFAMSARPTLEALSGDVQSVDLIALEAIRVFRPEIYARLRELRGVLMTPSSGYGSSRDPTAAAAISSLFDLAGSDVEVIRSLLRRLFPASRRHFENNSYGGSWLDTWRRGHRVAHADFLNLYFSRELSPDLLAFQYGESASALMSDGSAFGRFLDEISPDALESTIQSLEIYESTYSSDSVIPASIELLNRIDSIPDRPSQGMFDFNRPDLVVTRVVLRLIRSLQDEKEREEAVTKINHGLVSYSARLTLLHIVGYDEGAGHKLVSIEFADEISESLASELNTQGVTHPEREWDALRLYYWLAERMGDSYVAPSFSSVALVRQLFKSARSERKSQSVDSRSVRISEVLTWDPLVKVFGDEAAVARALELLEKEDGDTDLVKLLRRYIVDGWRPKPFASDEDDDE